MRRNPRAFTVASCWGLSPIRLFTRVTLSFLGTDGLLRHVAVGRATANGLQILKSLDAAQGIDGGLEDVVRIVRAEGLGEDVLDAGRLEDRAHRPARDDARSGHRGLQEHPAGAEVAGDLAGD